jgi:hypothetical protein
MAKDPNEFARGILNSIIAKHDPESVEGKDAKKVASGLKGGLKAATLALRPSQPRSDHR